MLRKIFIGGNWKMQASSEVVTKIVEMLNQAKLEFNDRDIVVAPSFVFLQDVKSKIRPEILVSAQNSAQFLSGAYTGEISSSMIKDIGLSWVILGHSERRKIYGETDKIIGEKIKLALQAGLKVIACIGETLEERKAQQTEKVLQTQMDSMIESISNNKWSEIVIAYEPVWAIGTGTVATPEEADSAHQFIRGYLKEKVSAEVAESTRIIYGGSVKGDNVEELFKKQQIDGFLVGGASLTADFIKIINCART